MKNTKRKDPKLRKEVERGQTYENQSNETFWDKHRLKVAYSCGFLSTMFVLALIEPKNILWFSIQFISYIITVSCVGFVEKWLRTKKERL